MINPSLTHTYRASVLKDNAPLIIMLHGYGSDENDLFSFASEFHENFCIVSVRAPYQIQPHGNAWYAINFDAEQGKWSDNAQAKKSRDCIVMFIDEVLQTYPIDENNITLLGFSQGSILSYSVALNYPEKIRHVVALSGYVNLDLNFSNYVDNDFSNLDIYCSHGSQDQVIPVEWARRTPAILNKLSISHVYEEYPIGHGVSPRNFSSFNKWIESKL